MSPTTNRTAESRGVTMDAPARVRIGLAALEWSRRDLARKSKVSFSRLGEFLRRDLHLSSDEEAAIGAVLVEALGGRVRDFFPHHIGPADGSDPIRLSRKEHHHERT